MKDMSYGEYSDMMHSEFPELFSSRYGGFEIGNGWYPLVHKTCKAIHSHIFFKEKSGNPIPPVQITQIKEKFGTLRFYYDGGDEYIRGIVTMAEFMSEVVCEKCGNLGSIHNNGRWLKTLCDAHKAEREAL